MNIYTLNFKRRFFERKASRDRGLFMWRWGSVQFSRKANLDEAHNLMIYLTRQPVQ